MSTETSDTLVKDVLAAMRKGATGDTDALDALGRQSSKEGKAAEEEKKVELPALLAKETYVTRPNGEKYYIRKLGRHHDVEVLRKAREKLIYPLLTGPPGTGKTALLEAAYCTTSKVYTVQGSGDTEVSDFVGGYVQHVIDGKTTFDWVDGPLLQAMEEGAVLYIDEIALIDPKVLAVAYGVIDGRNELRITQNPDRGVVTAKEGFFVVAACNPNAPGARMSEALLSRFKLQFEVTTDYALARKLGVDSRMITAAQNMQRKVEAGNVLSWAPQLRELLAFKSISDEFGEDTALRNMVTTAPELDRSQVADLISRSYHQTIKGLALT
jgi:MoxR-like ATPase